MSNNITSVPKIRFFHTIILFFFLSANLISYSQNGYNQAKKIVNSGIEGVIQLNANKTGNSISKMEYSIFQKNTLKTAKAMVEMETTLLILILFSIFLISILLGIWYLVIGIW